jgi:hypothetical protein
LVLKEISKEDGSDGNPNKNELSARDVLTEFA